MFTRAEGAQGIEAVDMVQDIKYDLTFMDCHMPEIDWIISCLFVKFKERIASYLFFSRQKERWLELKTP